MQVYRIVAEKTSLRALCCLPESELTREEHAYWNTVIPNVCTVLKLHLVISAQISYYSRVPQLTWNCVVDFEADPAFLALALASGVFFK